MSAPAFPRAELMRELGLRAAVTLPAGLPNPRRSKETNP